MWCFPDLTFPLPQHSQYVSLNVCAHGNDRDYRRGDETDAAQRWAGDVLTDDTHATRNSGRQHPRRVPWLLLSTSMTQRTTTLVIFIFQPGTVTYHEWTNVART